MKSFAAFLITIVYATWVQCNDEKLVELLKKEIGHLAISQPEKGSAVITNLKASSEFLLLSILHSELETVLRLTYNLPEEIISKFMGIAFSQSVTLQSFCLVLAKNEGHLDEYVGAAFNEKDLIRLTYIRVHSRGTLMPQYTIIKEEHSDTILIFIPIYWKTEKRIARGYSYEEVDTIPQALQASAYAELNQRFKNLNSDYQFILVQDQDFTSPSKEYDFLLQADGNLVIYHAGSAIWHIGTYNNYTAPYTFILKANGNMEVRDADNILTWESNTNGKGDPPHYILMQDDGNVVLYDKMRKPVWDSKNKLLSETFALPQNKFMFSPKGNYFALLQDDGNFIVYSTARKNGKKENIPIWCSATYEPAMRPFNLMIHNDGNMVIKGIEDTVIWETGTKNSGIPPYSLHLDDDGILTISDVRKNIIWSNMEKQISKFLH